MGEKREVTYLLVVFCTALVFGVLIGAHYKQVKDCDFFFDGMRYFVEYTNDTRAAQVADIMLDTPVIKYNPLYSWEFREFNLSDFEGYLDGKVA